MQHSIQSYSFADARSYLDISDGYSDNNEILTDGPLEKLLRVKIYRHGSINRILSGCKFHLPITMKGALKIFVAEDDTVVKIGPNTQLICDIRLWRMARVDIGAFTTINQARLVADNSDITIGEDCMLSDDILIQSADQHGLIDMKSMEFTNSNRQRITIGDHVWVGRRAVVMPDVDVGNGSVIGTGSIVTKSIDAMSYCVGVPARVVREGGSWTRQPNKINQREQNFFDEANSTKKR